MSAEVSHRQLGFCSLFLSIAAAMIPGLPAWAQTGATAVEAKLPSLEFEVAVIKPHPADESRHSGWQFTTDSFSVTNLTLKQLIFQAYELRVGAQLEGLPKWGQTEKWDIQAKIGDEAVEERHKLDRQQHAEENRLMLQKLLATRFGLRVHRETRELPIYDLVIAKSGSKLQASKTGEKGGGWNWGNGRFEGTDVGPDALAYSLSSSAEVGRLVVDKTGLKGKYDIALKWTPEGKQETADSGPSLFTALQEQLGLKLVPAKGPVDVVVVDHVEQPTPN